MSGVPSLKTRRAPTAILKPIDLRPSHARARRRRRSCGRRCRDRRGPAPWRATPALRLWTRRAGTRNCVVTASSAYARHDSTLTQTSRADTSAAFRRLDLAAVEPFAIEPDPRAGIALDAEIIARELVAAVVAPPFHGDALRAFDLRDLMRHVPPGKSHRRAVRHLRRWPRSAPAARTAESAGRRQACPARSIGAARRPHGCAACAGTAATAYSGICVSCGTSRVTRRRPKRAPSRSIRCASSSAWSAPARPVCAGSHALGDQRREPHHVVAEARIAGVAEHGEPLLEQFSHARRIAQRRAGADLEPVHLAVGAEQRELKQPRALAAPLQHADKLTRQMLDGAEHVGLARDRIGKALLGHRRRHRQARRDRLVGAAERLIEAEQQRLAEARGERRARTRGEIGDALRPEVFRSATISASMRSAAIGSGSTAASVSPRGTMPVFAIARDAPGAADRVGDRDARAKTLMREPRDQIAGQRRLAAEQMRAAGDVEQQAVRRIEADQRRVAVAPVGDRLRADAGRPPDRRPPPAAIGYMARASASPMPGLSPSRAAASFSAVMRCADLIDATTTQRLQPARTSGARSGRSRAAAATPTDTAGWKARS